MLAGTVGCVCTGSEEEPLEDEVVDAGELLEEELSGSDDELSDELSVLDEEELSEEELSDGVLDASDESELLEEVSVELLFSVVTDCELPLSVSILFSLSLHPVRVETSTAKITAADKYFFIIISS